MKQLLGAVALSSLLLVACGNDTSDSNQAVETSESMAEKSEQMDHSKMADGVTAQESKDIHLVSPEEGEIPMGDAELVVHVEKENLKPEDLSVEVSMPMAGEEDMTSLAIVEAGDEAQQFKIKTNFGMAGDWAVKVSAPDAEPVVLALTIQ